MLNAFDFHDARTTMRLTKTLGIAGALLLSALVGGTLIGSALATDEESDTDASTDTAYCDVFRDTLAAELGVSTNDLTAAGKAAANAAVDAAVAAGDLDGDRAATMRERIEAYDGAGCGWFGKGFGAGFGRGFENGFERGLARGIGGAGVLESAAEALGMEPSELRESLGEAESLEAIATDQGASYDELKATVLADVQVALDEAVANGLEQERADAMLEHVTTWLDAGGQLDELGGHLGPGMGRGHGPGGRWGDEDADAEESGT
jgi:hypothetical protein